MNLKTQMYLGERWEMVFARDKLTLRAYAPRRIAEGQHHVELPAQSLWIFEVSQVGDRHARDRQHH